MSWATLRIAALQRGETVSLRPRGNSMVGKVSSGQRVTVKPLGATPPIVGEIVLCKVNGMQFLHLVRAERLHQRLIGNNQGGINGWTPLSQIYGRCTAVSD